MADLARYTNRDIDFWVSMFQRDGRLAKGKLKAADILYRLGETKIN
ncbi:hypothetical protein NKI61_24005 [Mesorhizobium sp. M0514]